MAISYDPNALTSHADALYKLADRIVLSTAIQWGVLLGAGGFLFFIGTGLAGQVRGSGPGLFVIAGAVIGAIVGAAVAGPRAAELRLQAQMALCQAQIEFNTRTRPS